MNVTLHGKRNFADVTKLGILRWGLSIWALNIIKCVLIRKIPEGDLTTEEEVGDVMMGSQRLE